MKVARLGKRKADSKGELDNKKHKKLGMRSLQGTSELSMVTLSVTWELFWPPFYSYLLCVHPIRPAPDLFTPLTPKFPLLSSSKTQNGHC